MERARDPGRGAGRRRLLLVVAVVVTSGAACGPALPSAGGVSIHAPATWPLVVPTAVATAPPPSRTTRHRIEGRVLLRDRDADETLTLLLRRVGAPASFTSADLRLLTDGLELPAGVTAQTFERVRPLIESMERGKEMPCPQGFGGAYSDIRRGARVTVRDGSGLILDVARLTGGTLSSRGCLFEFEVSARSRRSYSFEVTRRGASTYSLEKLARGEWRVDLAIG